MPNFKREQRRKRAAKSRRHKKVPSDVPESLAHLFEGDSDDDFALGDDHDGYKAHLREKVMGLPVVNPAHMLGPGRQLPPLDSPAAIHRSKLPPPNPDYPGQPKVTLADTLRAIRERERRKELAALKRRRELENHLDPLQAMRDERQEHEQQLLRELQEAAAAEGGGSRDPSVTFMTQASSSMRSAPGGLGPGFASAYAGAEEGNPDALTPHALGIQRHMQDLAEVRDERTASAKAYRYRSYEDRRAQSLEKLADGERRKRQAARLIAGMSKYEQNEVVRHLFTSVSKMRGEIVGTATETYGSYLWLRLLQLGLSAKAWHRGLVAGRELREQVEAARVIQAQVRARNRKAMEKRYSEVTPFFRKRVWVLKFKQRVKRRKEAQLAVGRFALDCDGLHGGHVQVALFVAVSRRLRRNIVQAQRYAKQWLECRGARLVALKLAYQDVKSGAYKRRVEATAHAAKKAAEAEAAAAGGGAGGGGGGGGSGAGAGGGVGGPKSSKGKKSSSSSSPAKKSPKKKKAAPKKKKKKAGGAAGRGRPSRARDSGTAILKAKDSLHYLRAKIQKNLAKSAEILGIDEDDDFMIGATGGSNMLADVKVSGKVNTIIERFLKERRKQHVQALVKGGRIAGHEKMSEEDIGKIIGAEYCRFFKVFSSDALWHNLSMIIARKKAARKQQQKVSSKRR